MHELGQLLRKERIAKGITLDDLQESTKIRKRYLEAIEEGNFKILPGNFYVRAFIKSYAEAVGLDPGELLRMYRNVLPAADPEPAVEPVRRSRSASKSSEGMGKWATGIMLWSFLILILALIYYFVSTYNDPEGKVKNSTGEKEKITSKVSSDINGAGSATPGAGDSKQGTGQVSPTPTPTPSPTPTPTPASSVQLVRTDEKGTEFYTVNGSDKIKVEMTVIGEKCWIEVDSPKNKLVEQGNMVKGTTKSWELTGSAYVVLGAASAIDLKVNGTPIPVGDALNVKRFQFDAATGTSASGTPAP